MHPQNTKTGSFAILVILDNQLSSSWLSPMLSRYFGTGCTPYGLGSEVSKLVGETASAVNRVPEL